MTKTFPLAYLLLVILLAFLIDIYVYQGVKAASSRMQSGRKRTLLRIAYWIINIGLMVAVTISFSAFDRSKPPSIGLMRLIGFYFAMLIPKLIFCISLLLEDLYRLLNGIVRFLYHKRVAPLNPEGVIYFPGRRKFVSQIGLGLAAIPFLSILHGMTRGKYKYTLHRETLYFEDLPEAFDGFTITQISDIHSGSFDNKEGVMKGIRMVQEQKSDLFVFTGDLVNNFAPEMDPWLDVFKHIEAPYGKYSILGNHDYGDYSHWTSEEAKNENHERIKAHHKTLGYTLMLNEHTFIEKGGQRIALVGIENWGLGFKQKGDLKKALRGLDDKEFKVLLSHDPSHWDAEAKKSSKHIHLTLAGHTHGMQFGIEIPGFKWSPIQMRYPKWAGLYQEQGKYLYVNRGFGFIGFPGRVGIWPEVTVITLKKTA
jgi:predicted MPP superfamily phosphohydrolase